MKQQLRILLCLVSLFLVHPIEAQVCSACETGECMAPGPNLISNGDFADFVYPDYTPSTPGTLPDYWLPGDPLAYGIVFIYDTAFNLNWNWLGTGHSGTSDFLICDSKSASHTSAWGQKVPVNSNTNYFFKAWANNISIPDYSDPKLRVKINGEFIGPTFTLYEDPDEWISIECCWNSGPAPIDSALIEIVNVMPGGWGKDFGLDDISFYACYPNMDTIPISICDGMTYTFPDGATASETGFYNIEYMSDDSCDIHQTYLLSYFNPAPIVINYDFCFGEEIMLADGTFLFADTTFIDTLINMLGCDSIIVKSMNFNPLIEVYIEDVICQGSSYTLPDGIVASTPGFYTSLLSSVSGCDSFVYTHLIESTLISEYIVASICEGSAYLLPDGTTTETEGTYFFEFAVDAGCDSNYTIAVEVYDYFSDTIELMWAPDTTFILPDGIAVIAPGIYTSYLIASGGCDSIITTIITSPTSNIETNTPIVNVTYEIISNQIQIQYTNITSSVTVQLINSVGQIIEYRELPPSSGELNLYAPGNGYYIVQITAASNAINYPIILL